MTTLVSSAASHNSIVPYQPGYSGSSPVMLPDGTEITINWTIAAGANWNQKQYKPGLAYTWADLEEAWYDGVACNLVDDHFRAKSKILDSNRQYVLPDQALIEIDDKGNYKIINDNAKVIYKANNIRDFSPYINASDQLANFIDYARKLGVKLEETLSLPISLFISWLIIKAAETDGDELPYNVIPPDKELLKITKPKCLTCGKYIKSFYHRNKFNFCNLDHAKSYYSKIN